MQRNQSRLYFIWITNALSRYYGGRGTYPPLTSTYLTGACTGSFAVAAISSSRSIGELLAPAVEAVIAAFKTAIYSLNLRNDTDYRGSTGSNSWSVVVGIHESEAAQLVTTFNAGKVSFQGPSYLVHN